MIYHSIGRGKDINIALCLTESGKTASVDERIVNVGRYTRNGQRRQDFA
jgi:hypothetical protein